MLKKINIEYNTYLELEKIGIGAFDPLKRFMTKADFISVVEKMRLPNGKIFPLPILFPVEKKHFNKIVLFSRLNLFYKDIHVGNIHVEDAFELSLEKYLKKIYGTSDKKHPGAAMMLKLGSHFIGGKIKLIKNIKKNKSQLEKSPRQLKILFKKKKFKTIAGFQTRNIPHKAHEFIHRLALEQVDGLLIQPIVGEKKEGDFTAEAVMKSYKYLIDNYYPKKKVVLTSLSTFMRYAGPREAIFHALIRRNYGCTHFIVGRDHAGVSNYYKVYEAQDISKKFEKELGIKILSMKGPFYCNKCENIVTENSCPHKSNSVNYIEEISGTRIRSMILGKIKINKKFLRPDLLKKIIKLNLFIEKK